jgi:hypothetical protein
VELEVEEQVERIQELTLVLVLQTLEEVVVVLETQVMVEMVVLE